MSQKYWLFSVVTKGQCTNGPTTTTVESSKQLIVKLNAKNQKNLQQSSEYNFEKVILSPNLTF